MLLFLGTVLRLAAKDFWKSTPPSEWKEEETMKMLTDSPWARTVSVLAGTLGVGQAAQWMADLPSLSTTEGGRDTASSMTGVRVAVRDIDGDGIVDILTSSGERVSAFRGGNLSVTENPPTLFDFDPDPAGSGDFWIG